MPMKHTVYTLATLALLASTLSAGAAPSDVPPSHWAARSVASVTAKKLIAPLPNGQFNSDKPVTRYELAVALDRFVRYIEAGRKPLHPTTAQAPAPLAPRAPADAKQARAHLTQGGFLPAKSPLLTRDGTKPATAQELADALAQITVRLSDRSLPPNKE